MMIMKSASTVALSSNAWMRSGAMNALVSFLESSSIDPVTVVGPEGMRIVEAADPYRKVSMPVILEAFQKTADASGRPDLGLEVGLGHELEAWGPFLMLFLNAPTVGTAIKDLCQYFGALQSGTFMECFDAGNNGFGLTYQNNHSACPGWEIDNELTVGLVMSIVNGLSASRIVPTAVSYEHSPLTDVSTYVQWLGVEPAFGAESTRLLYTKGVASIESAHDNAELYKVLSRHLRDLSEKVIEENLLVHIVRNNVVHGLKAGTATLEHIAAELGLEPRSLQRRLADEGTSFRKLIDEVRLARARHLLTNTRLRITDIAVELGYSESRSFIRSFERLTGMSPGKYRQENSGNP